MTTKYIVNNVSGQTINGQQLQPYKVYTALLTQSGGDNVLDISSGALTQGVTYYFGVLLEGQQWDFSNVGGPVYPNTNSFVATSNDAPNSYGGQSIYYNTGAPVVTVLENTIGNVWWTYLTSGQYQVESDALFTEDKTICTTSGIIDVASDPWKGYSSVVVSANYVGIRTGEVLQGTYDDLLFNSPIEIRVYN